MTRSEEEAIEHNGVLASLAKEFPFQEEMFLLSEEDLILDGCNLICLYARTKNINQFLELKEGLKSYINHLIAYLIGLSINSVSASRSSSFQISLLGHIAADLYSVWDVLSKDKKELPKSLVKIKKDITKFRKINNDRFFYKLNFFLFNFHRSSSPNE